MVTDLCFKNDLQIKGSMIKISVKNGLIFEKNT